MEVATVSADPWSEVIGQEHAVGQLRQAVRRPVHAYLLLGPSGSGARVVARAFAAALLAAELDGADAERVVRLALADRHPDLHSFERTGPFISADQARAIGVEASRSAVEGERKVLVLSDFHLVRDAGPILLKSIEEPPAGTIFVVLADFVPPELVPIASRCSVIELDSIPQETIVAALQDQGAPADLAQVVAASVDGDLDRARLLVGDPRFLLRRQAWHDVPTSLDGTGAAVFRLVADLRAMIDDAQGPLEAVQAQEVAELQARIEAYGERGSGRRELTDRHKRQLRRLRTDELRFGLATLARRYRDAVSTGAVSGRQAREALAAIDAIGEANAALIRNPVEALLLQALFLRLPELPAG